jgi:hypothetical protein
VTQRGKVGDAVVGRAVAAGLSSAAILEVVTECVCASLIASSTNLAGRVELDVFLQPRTWTP